MLLDPIKHDRQLEHQLQLTACACRVIESLAYACNGSAVLGLRHALVMDELISGTASKDYKN